MLHTVTLTGADDATDVSKLAELSAEFPFVEWGILVGSVEGANRFPSFDWIDALVEERVKSDNKMRLSLHLCGKWLRDASAGNLSIAETLGAKIAAFSRVQLNFHGVKLHPIVGERLFRAFCNVVEFEPEIIFQLDGQNDELFQECGRRFKVSGLFDVSHGAGVLPDAWPKRRNDMECGYAGGLAPWNVAEQLPLILEAAGGMSHWIDMETHLRSPRTDSFSMLNCREVLKDCAPSVVTR